MRGGARTPLGARVAPVAVDVRQAPLSPAAPPTQVVAPPVVGSEGVALAPDVAVVELTDPDPAVTDVEEELRPAVDVLPTALLAQVPVQRGPDLTIRRATIRRAILPTTTDHGAAVRLPRPEVRLGRPAALLDVRVRATPPARIGAEHLRRCLTALLRRSGAASAADLALVGVFERVPGGAVHSVTAVEGGVRLRLAPGSRPRPATLVVGRRRSTGGLVTVELPAVPREVRRR